MKTWTNIELLKEQVDDLDLSEGTKLSLWNTIDNIEEDFKYNDLSIIQQELKLKNNEIWKLKHELYEALDLNDQKYIRINNAITYIKEKTTDEETGKDLGYSDAIDYEELLNILKGDNK